MNGSYAQCMYVRSLGDCIWSDCRLRFVKANACDGAERLS